MIQAVREMIKNIPTVQPNNCEKNIVIISIFDWSCPVFCILSLINKFATLVQILKLQSGDYLLVSPPTHPGHLPIRVTRVCEQVTNGRV